jgi:hypothetical protein
MKINFLALVLLIILSGCQNNKLEKAYQPRALVAGEDFNTYIKANENPFTIMKVIDDGTVSKDNKEIFTIKYRDTTVQIIPDEADKKTVVDKFSLATFVNTQKTCILVQLADQSGLIAPYYLVTLKNDQPEVVKLYRPSTGVNDRVVTKGLYRVGNSGYLINNDYFITNVNAKVFPIKRQKADERIQGEFFIQSSDKKTLVFLMNDSFYEVHYPSGETLTVAFSAGAPQTKRALYAWVQANFIWKKNERGISFLKENDQNADKIFDMRRKLK